MMSAVVAFLLQAPSAHAGGGNEGLTVELGPISRAASGKRVVLVDAAARRQATWYDVQDGREHNVRGLPLTELLEYVKAPRAADTVIFSYTDGMEIPVRLADRDEVKAIFVALEHGDAMNHFNDTYPLLNAAELHCPKVVYGRRITTYSTWIYPGDLAAIRLVTWKAYASQISQATRRLPDRSGWPIYLQHCQNCDGIGGHGAKRGADFLSDMEAYRRVPPLAVTDVSAHPSLHEKVKGFTDGKMPVLNHVHNRDIATLWRWLHAIHASATK
jgi:hypothetical protein